jgi:hypothetical protein
MLHVPPSIRRRKLRASTDNLPYVERSEGSSLLARRGSTLLLDDCDGGAPWSNSPGGKWSSSPSVKAAEPATPGAAVAASKEELLV